MQYNKEKNIKAQDKQFWSILICSDLLKKLNPVQVIYSLHFLNNCAGLCIHEELL